MSKKKAYALRVSPEILDEVQRWADDELRSVNAQIEYVLREALRNAGRLPQPNAASSDDAVVEKP
ncbi:MAG: Arc family DNA-binding protein [Pseudomonadales bacterium]